MSGAAIAFGGASAEDQGREVAITAIQDEREPGSVEVAERVSRLHFDRDSR